MTIDANLRIKTARLFRSSRKLVRMTQIDVSKALDVAQGTISKLEAGILEPNADEWYRYCEIVGIDPSISFNTGLIFKKVTKPLLKKAKFKLPKCKSQEWVSVKECIPFVDTINGLGLSEKFERYLKANNVDRDVFTIVNFVVPSEVLGIVLDFVEANISSKSIEAVSEHSIVKNLYLKDIKRSKSLSREELLKKLMQQMDLLEENASYEVNGSSIKLSMDKKKSEHFQRSLRIKAKILSSICRSEYNYNVKIQENGPSEFVLQMA